MPGMSLPFPVTALASSASHVIAAAGSTLHVFPTSSPSSSPSSASSFTLSPSTSSSSSSSASTPISITRQVAISPSGQYVATASDDKSLRVYSLQDRTLLSTRTLTKKCADLQFATDESLLVADRVGDLFSYPLHSRVSEEARLAGSSKVFGIQADPTTNPDADLLLGHVSVLTSITVTPDGQNIISADRDEHIRVSRYPQSTFVIERYLFGSEGFVSAVHIPSGLPDTLISAGGERDLRIWNWRTAECQEKVDIEESALPHRRVRSHMRKVKGKGKKRGRNDSGAADGAESETKGFYDAPEGWILPSGEGICVKKISSMEVAGRTVVLFFSEGSAAIHALPLSPTGPISTFPLPSPILDFAPIPSSPGHVLASLDTAWGVLRQNPLPGKEVSAIPSPDLSDASIVNLRKHLAVISVSSNGDMAHVDDPILSLMLDELNKAETSTSVEALSRLHLYPLLSILPRWPGMEEDDDLAGPSEPQPEASDSPSSKRLDVTESARITASTVLDPKKNYTREELSQMNQKQLGRLRSQGVMEVEEFIVKPPSKKKRRKAKKGKKNGAEGGAVAGGEGDSGDEEEGEVEGDNSVQPPAAELLGAEEMMLHQA